MIRKAAHVLLGLVVALLLAAPTTAATVSYQCQSLSPDTIVVTPGESIVWTTNGSCAYGACYYCYNVIVPGVPGGPFGVAGWFGPGYWDYCDPYSPYVIWPTSPPVEPNTVPGDYSYLVETSTLCITQGAIAGTIRVTSLPTPTLRRSWGQLKGRYR